MGKRNSTTLIADALTKKEWEDTILYGPLSYDFAIDPDSARFSLLPIEKTKSKLNRTKVVQPEML